MLDQKLCEYTNPWVPRAAFDNVTVNTYPEKVPPPPDLPPSGVYLTYPNYYIGPFHYPNPVTGKAMPAPAC